MCIQHICMVGTMVAGGPMHAREGILNMQRGASFTWCSSHAARAITRHGVAVRLQASRMPPRPWLSRDHTHCVLRCRLSLDQPFSCCASMALATEHILRRPLKLYQRLRRSVCVGGAKASMHGAGVAGSWEAAAETRLVRAQHQSIPVCRAVRFALLQVCNGPGVGLRGQQGARGCASARPMHLAG